MAIKEYRLGNLCSIRNNLRTPISQNLRDKMEEKYPYYGANGIIDFVDFYKIDFDCILVAEDGSVINQNGILNVQFINNKKISVSNHAHVIQNINSKIELKYLYYSLLKINARQFISGSVQQKLSLKNLLNIKLNIPNLQTQQEIINIIEPFEKLREKYNNKKSNLINLLNCIYEINKNNDSKINLLDFAFLNNKKYDNQSKYIETSNINDNYEICGDLKAVLKDEKPSRANLTPINNSLIFSKLKGSNKLFVVYDKS